MGHRDFGPHRGRHHRCWSVRGAGYGPGHTTTCQPDLDSRCRISDKCGYTSHHRFRDNHCFRRRCWHSTGRELSDCSAKNYYLPIGRLSECPFPAKDQVPGVQWGSLMLWADEKSTLARLDSDPASYGACKKNTRYVNQVGRLDANDEICYVGKGVVAAISVTKTVNIGNVDSPAEFSITIWQG